MFQIKALLQPVGAWAKNAAIHAGAYIVDAILPIWIDKIVRYLQSRKNDGAGDVGDLVIKQQPEESWLAAVAPVILDQLKMAGGNGSFMVPRDTVLSIRQVIEANGRKMDIKLHRRNGEFDLQIRGYKVGTLECLSDSNDSRRTSPSPAKQTSSKMSSTRDVEVSPYIYLDTKAPSRRDSVAYIYPQQRSSNSVYESPLVKSKTNLRSSDSTIIIDFKACKSRSAEISPSTSKSKANSVNFSQIYLCSPSSHSRRASGSPGAASISGGCSAIYVPKT